jgi:hypothetical protein
MIRNDGDEMIAAMMDGIAIVQERAAHDAEREALEVVRLAFLAEDAG